MKKREKGFFYRADGYKEVDLLHSARDHLDAARWLFASHPNFLDSAGYLSHLGIELILKAFLLHRDGKFPKEHSLAELLRDAPITLHPMFDETITLLDGFEQLRYPIPKPKRAGMLGEIGDEDWRDIYMIRKQLLRWLPPKLREEYDAIKDNEKGGRVLMEKVIGAGKMAKIEREAEKEFAAFAAKTGRGGSLG
jgi:HEPN domain-containing protein